MAKRHNTFRFFEFQPTKNKKTAFAWPTQLIGPHVAYTTLIIRNKFFFQIIYLFLKRRFHCPRFYISKSLQLKNNYTKEALCFVFITITLWLGQWIALSQVESSNFKDFDTC
jgi:hypothetical protein